jgi:hypothetical protein
MSDVEDSFNSTGATEVAFETINTEGFPAFGVSVVGTTCGVYGRNLTMAGDPDHDRRTAPANTGVFGRGDSHGVYGVTSGVSDQDTPDFTQETGPGAGIPVVGVNNGIGPAILGDCGLIGVDFPKSEALQDVVELSSGVAGVAVSGPGLLGVSLSGDPRADAFVDEVVPGREFTDGTNVRDPGVMGIGVRSPGVRGASQFDRGAVFESAFASDQIVAQIRLLPARRSNTPPGADPVAPDNVGEAGDLLALTYVDANLRQRAGLFFCIEGVSTLGTALWLRIV